MAARRTRPTRGAVKGGGKSARKTNRSRGRAKRRGVPRAKGAALRAALGPYLKAATHVGAIALLGVLAIGLALVYLARDLPRGETLWAVDARPTVTLVDRTGETFASYGGEYGRPVRLADLPPHLPNAVVAVEDRNFRGHIGFNPIAILRALAVNMNRGAVVQGGSTITQQLAKNLFLSPERTIKRKAQELLLAMWLEIRFTKDQILTLYLNRVYFGAGAYGVESAAQRYFGKSARDVNVTEAAMLAGLLKAPSRDAPTHAPDRAGRRAKAALDAMRDAGYLSPEDHARASARKITLATGASERGGLHFADYVVAQVPGLIGRYDGDLTIHTTLDVRAQRAAETALHAGFAAWPAAQNGAQTDAQDGAQGALVALEGDGAVRAMVGGRDYAESQFNRATEARRQPGSAFKPFLYLAALENGRRPSDRIEDAPLTEGKWRPANFNDRYFGEVTLAEALAKSLNTAAVRLSREVGLHHVAATASRLGLDAPLPPDPAIALGVYEVTPLQLASAYAQIANGGYQAEAYVIERIEDETGAVLYARDPQPQERAIDRRSAETLSAMLENVVQAGTGRRARLSGRFAAGKTGTSQNHRDAWFAGFTTEMTTVVWVGQDRGAAYGQMTGGGLPADIWRRFMMAAPAAPIWERPS